MHAPGNTKKQHLIIHYPALGNQPKRIVVDADIEGDIPLEVLQDCVKGGIEICSLRESGFFRELNKKAHNLNFKKSGQEWCLFANDEGMLKGLHPNPWAANRLFGDLVLTISTNQGRTIGLTEEQLKMLPSDLHPDTPIDDDDDEEGE